MPGAAALALISGGSSAMTGIFSSRADSEEVLAAGWVSVVAGVGAGAAVTGAVAATGAFTLGLAFSLVVFRGCWVVGFEVRGASQLRLVSCCALPFEDLLVPYLQP